MNPPKTPTKAHDDLNNLVRNLSAKWNLQLPVRYVATSPSQRQRQNPDSLLEKILDRIGFLYFKDMTALHGVIANFEEWVVTGWKYKPLQEPGTIPVSATGASFLRTSQIPQSAIGSLLKHLSKLLEDDFYLVKARMESHQSLPAMSVRTHRDSSWGCFTGETSQSESQPREVAGKAERQATLDFGKSGLQEQSGSRTLSMSSIMRLTSLRRWKSSLMHRQRIIDRKLYGTKSRGPAPRTDIFRRMDTCPLQVGYDAPTISISHIGAPITTV